MRASVIVFPGSNCDRDAAMALLAVTGKPPAMVWHGDSEIPDSDLIVLPGGFSYGDALRCGAISRFAPVMDELQKAADGGMPILGICNGFQVLCESHMLPGALLRNKTLQFHCFRTNIRIENASTAWTNALSVGDVLNLPIAHGEGQYYIDDRGLSELEANGQIVARYCEPDGAVTLKMEAIQLAGALELRPKPARRIPAMTASPASTPATPS